MTTRTDKKSKWLPDKSGYRDDLAIDSYYHGGRG